MNRQLFNRAVILMAVVAMVLSLGIESSSRAAPAEPLNTPPPFERSGQFPRQVMHADDDSKYVELVGHIDGAFHALSVQGSYAYVGEGLSNKDQRLVILDISDPASPAVVGKTSPFPGFVRDIAVAGDYAYVADGQAGLRVVDVSNPASPIEVAFYNLPEDHADAYRVAVAGDPSSGSGQAYAYVAFDGYRGGLRVVDVSNPANPMEVGFYDPPGDRVLGVDVVGSYAYAVGYDAYAGGMWLLDVSTPSSPTEVGFYNTHPQWGPRDVAVAGDYAYVADWVGDLRVLDVSAPSNPVLVGSYVAPEGPCVDVAVAGRYAYVFCVDSGLRVVDVSDPADPTEFGFYNPGGGAGDVAVAEGYVYVLAGGGLSILRYTGGVEPTYEGAENVELVGTFDTPGEARRVDVAGGYAYVAAAGAGLRVVDVSDLANPTEVGFWDTRGVWDVAIAGSYAYVVAGGLGVIDVSDPANPVEVGFYDVHSASGVAVAGGYAYVAAVGAGLRVIDVSAPTSPREVGFYQVPGGGAQAWGVAVAGRYVYIAYDLVGLRVVDVSTPASPTEVGFYDTGAFAVDVAVVESYAYVATGGGLGVIDISDPGNPTKVGSCAGGYDVAVAGSYAYTTDWRDLRVIDVSTPANPTEVGFYRTPGVGAYGVDVAGDYIYLADRWEGLLILRYTGEDEVEPTHKDAENVELVGHIGGGTGAVAVQEDYAYIISEGPRLTILDISNPASPVLLGKTEPLPDSVVGVAVAGDYAYVADYDAGLRVVDVSSPANPTEVGSYQPIVAGLYEPPATVYGVAVAGGYVYVVGMFGLRVIDVSMPSNPTEAGSYDAPAWAFRVTVAGDYAYITLEDVGLQVVDVSVPSNPRGIGFYDVRTAFINSVDVAGNYAYVAHRDGWDGSQYIKGGLRVVDISTPSNPTEVGFCDTPGTAWDVAIAGGYAYVATGSAGLRVVDVSTPGNPMEVGFYDTPGDAVGVAIAGGYVYVADRSGGLLVLRYTGEVETPDLLITALSTAKAEYYANEPITFQFAVQNQSDSPITFKPGVRVVDANGSATTFTSQKDYTVEAHRQLWIVHLQAPMAHPWTEGATRWQVLLRGPPPDYKELYAESELEGEFSIVPAATGEINARIASLDISPARVQVDDTLTIQFDLQNTGEQDWSFLVECMIWGPEGYVHQLRQTLSVPQGQASSGMFNWPVPADAPAGTYDLEVRVYEETEVLDYKEAIASFMVDKEYSYVETREFQGPLGKRVAIHIHHTPKDVPISLLLVEALKTAKWLLSLHEAAGGVLHTISAAVDTYGEVAPDLVAETATDGSLDVLFLQLEDRLGLGFLYNGASFLDVGGKLIPPATVTAVPMEDIPVPGYWRLAPAPPVVGPPNADWEEVGPGSATDEGISDNSGDSGAPSLAIAPDGTPYVAWWDGSGGNAEIYVRRWNGNSWQEVGAGSASGGGISNNSGSSQCPAVAIAPDGTPYVAWSNTIGRHDLEIYVRHWNGSSWEEVGTGSATGGGISNSGSSHWPSLAIAPDGTPHVAWTDSSGGNDSDIYVRHWNGSSWEEVGAGSAAGGGISDSSGGSWWPSLAIAPDGTPYVAWLDGSGANGEIYVRRWNGKSWQEVGTGSASGGGISNNSGFSYRPSVAVAPDGTPYVVWSDESGGAREIYVRCWNGSSWEEAGTDSATGGGISDSSRDSMVPSMAIAPDGTPYVAWSESAGDGEIYVRRWNGSSWEEVGGSSASGGGISDNSGGSGLPSVAIAPDGTPYVAWTDSSGGNCSGIYVRRWRGEPEPTYSISGHVRDASGNPLSGVAISAGAEGSAVTDASGVYTLTGLSADTYTITPSKSGYTFTPATHTVSVPPDATEQHFTATYALPPSPAVNPDLQALADEALAALKAIEQSGLDDEMQQLDRFTEQTEASGIAGLITVILEVLASRLPGGKIMESWIARVIAPKLVELGLEWGIEQFIEERGYQEVYQRSVPFLLAEGRGTIDARLTEAGSLPGVSDGLRQYMADVGAYYEFVGWRHPILHRDVTDSLRAYREARAEREIVWQLPGITAALVYPPAGPLIDIVFGGLAYSSEKEMARALVPLVMVHFEEVARDVASVSLAFSNVVDRAMQGEEKVPTIATSAVGMDQERLQIGVANEYDAPVAVQAFASVHLTSPVLWGYLLSETTYYYIPRPDFDLQIVSEWTLLQPGETEEFDLRFADETKDWLDKVQTFADETGETVTIHGSSEVYVLYSDQVDMPISYLAARKAQGARTRRVIEPTPGGAVSPLPSPGTQTPIEEDIEQGEFRSYAITVDRELENLYWTLTYPGSDLDLHLFDPAGRHLGKNYETGETDLQVPGAQYSGSDANPEWVKVIAPALGEWRVTVVGTQVDAEGEPFSLDISQGYESATLLPQVGTCAVGLLLIGLTGSMLAVIILGLRRWRRVRRGAEIESIRREALSAAPETALYGHICPKCKIRLPDEARFCPRCGGPAEDVPPPTLPEAPAGLVCSNCGERLVEGVVFCPSCGTRVEAPPSAPAQVCASCGAALVEGVLFCPECGARVEGREPVPVGASEAESREGLGEASGATAEDESLIEGADE